MTRVRPRGELEIVRDILKALQMEADKTLNQNWLMTRTGLADKTFHFHVDRLIRGEFIEHWKEPVCVGFRRHEIQGKIDRGEETPPQTITHRYQLTSSGSELLHKIKKLEQFLNRGKKHDVWIGGESLNL